MKAVAIALMLLLSKPAFADELPVCDRTDASCLIRQSLTLKYQVNALTAENQMLKHENAELRENPSPSPKSVVFCIALGAAFFGSLYTASKVFH